MLSQQQIDREEIKNTNKSHRNTKLSEFISPQRTSINKTPLCDKIQNHYETNPNRNENAANSLMNDELKRRIEKSGTRSQRAKKLMNEKVHQVLINEINNNCGIRNTVNTLTQPSPPQSSMVNLESTYREIFMKGVLNQENSNDESIAKDMPLQLKEVPHPQPERPVDSPFKSSENETKHCVKKLQLGDVIQETNETEKDEESCQQEDEIDSAESQHSVKDSKKEKRFLQRVKLNHLQDGKQVAQKKENNNEMLVIQNQKSHHHQRQISQIIVNQNDINKTLNSPIAAKSPQYQCNSPRLTTTINRVTRSNTKDINVNAEEIKRILNQSKSKVRQMIQIKTQGVLAKTRNINSQSQRQSREFKITEQQQQSQYMTPRKECAVEGLDPILQKAKDDAIVSLNDINARVLQRFYTRRQNAISDSDYDVGYLLTMIVSLVDESIILSSDRSDLKAKSWDDLQKQLANYGKVVYSLQKLKYVLDNTEYIAKSLRKMNFLRKVQLMTAQADNVHESGFPIVHFIEKVSIFVDELLSKVKPLQTQPKTQNVSRQMSPAPLKSTAASSRLSQRVTPVKQLNTSRNKPSQLASSDKQSSSSKKETKFTNMIALKRETVKKTYDSEIRQCMIIQKQEEKAKRYSLEVARMELERKKMIAIMNKEDIQEKESKINKEEVEYVQYQTEMRSKLSSPNQIEDQLQKQRFQEHSLQETQFKKEIRMLKKEEEMQSIKKESQQTLDEKEWKEQAETKKRQQEMQELHLKAEKLYSVREQQNQVEIKQRETETDQRISAQLQKANFKFKKIEEQRNSIQHEMALLQTMRQSKKKLM